MFKNYTMRLVLTNFIGSRVVDFENEDGISEKGVFIPFEMNGLHETERGNVAAHFFVTERMTATKDGSSHYVKLKMPKEYKDFLDKKGIPYTERLELDKGLTDTDILYMTRVQQERFSDPMEYEKVKDVYSLTASMLNNSKPNMKILHPLPRVNEISQDVDDTPFAYYFKQAENGMYVRMAIIAYLLGYR